MRWPRTRCCRLIFGHSPIVYFAHPDGAAGGVVPEIAPAAGLILRAVGENDHSAHSIGYSVIGVRYAAIAFGGAMAGIGGAYFSHGDHADVGRKDDRRARLDRAGAGGVCRLAHGRLLAGAYFFGVLMALELYAKASRLFASCRRSSGPPCPIL